MNKIINLQYGPKYIGGPKNNGRFAFFEYGFMIIGHNHRPMTRNARVRFLNRFAGQKGRKVN